MVRGRLLQRSIVSGLLAGLAFVSEAWAAQPGASVADRTYAVRSGIGADATRAARTPEVALFVLWHDRRTGAVLQLGLSSDGFADRHFQRAAGVTGVWLGVVPRPPASLEALAAPEAARAPDVDAAMLLERWSALAVLAPNAQAARAGGTWGPNGVAVTRPGLVVVGIGLPPGAVEASADALRAPGAKAEVALLQLGSDARQWWPSAMPVRSAVYARRGGSLDASDELLRVDVDARGRANQRLSDLHLRHLGDVELPARIEAAERAEAVEDRRRHLRAAIEAARAALTMQPKEPLWRADLALALALLDPRDDRALLEIEQAVSAHRRRADVRLRAARVLALRGEPQLAQRQLGEALRLAPDDPRVQAAVHAAQLP